MKITRPTLIIDEVKARKNIAFMAEKAKKSNMVFRPHFKTHQSATVARWFREMEVNHIAVSSLAMAHYFYRHGWDDIHIAFPYNVLEHQELNELAKHIKLTVSIESQQALTHLKSHMKTPIRYMIKTDVGYGRTGIDASNWESILSLADQGNSICQFSGLMAHAGHTYDAHGTDEIEKAHKTSLQKLEILVNRFIDPPFVSYGDTPSCSVSENFNLISEFRCGNFVYYDLTQVAIGSCTVDQIAVAMACPIVAEHYDRNEVVIYGGAVHFSKDFVMSPRKHFGQIVTFNQNGWEVLEGVYLKKISQEHGIIHLPKNVDKNQFSLGHIIGVLPVHSCLTADLMMGQQTLSGNPIDKMIRI